MTGLPDILASFKRARILVVGDVMLDRFLYARVSRISPEAPVPILAVERETVSLGGAGNVARNIASLGGRATLIGGKGNDAAGAKLEALIACEPGLQSALVTSGGARTTEKIRYIADQQQVMRADMETPWPDAGGGEILAAARAAIDAHDALVISDYAKGFLPPSLVAELIALARSRQKPVIVDPKGMRLSQYDGASVITPNRHEASAATIAITGSDDSAASAAGRLLEALPKLEAALITRGSAGMTLQVRGKDALHIPARAREVFDVSGAGDTVVAALALALAVKSDWEDAARLANCAAGIAVTKVGTAAVRADEVMAELQAGRMAPVERKIVSAPRAKEMIETWRARGQRIGFTNGCFDLLHPGHVSLLSQARARADRLVVGLNSDASVRKLKGEGRPVQSGMARAIVLASLALVDLVVVFGEDTPEQLIHMLKPDLLVKGADYRREEIVGADFVSSYGGEVMRAELMPEHSTTGLIGRARE